MNWETAKNLIIFFLVIINIILLFLIQNNNMNYSLSSERTSEIIALLEKNNISISSGDIIKSYKPIRSIEVLSEPAKMFNDIYSEDIVELTETDAVSRAKKYISSLSPDFSSFQVDTVTSGDNYVLVDFRDTFKKNIIYSNYFQYRMNDKGIVEINCMYNTINNFYGNTQKICAPDEALLTFLYNIRKIYVETEHLIIDKIDLVYYLESDEQNTNADIRAIPCYRISLKDSPETFLINAYYNTMV